MRLWACACPESCSDISQTQISPTSFTKRRHLLIYPCRECGSAMVSSVLQAPAQRISPLFPSAVLGWRVIQSQTPAVDFVHKYEHVFTFKCVLIPPPGTLYSILSCLFLSQTFLAYLDMKNKECKYAGYLDTYLQYPPKGLLPLPGQDTGLTPDVIFGTISSRPPF